MSSISATLKSETDNSIINTVVASFTNATEKNVPYKYWLFDNALPLQDCLDVTVLPITPPEEYDTLGKRDSRNDLRRFFSPEMQAKFPVIAKIATAFQSTTIVQSIEKLCDVSLKDTYLRIEYCQDRNGFWLEPHMDIKEKRITIQIYLNQGEDADTLGTDIYNPDKSYFGTAPSRINQGMVFVPKEPVSFHGFTKRTIKDVRRSLIINYVTDDWRAIQELSFPDNKVNY